MEETRIFIKTLPIFKACSDAAVNQLIEIIERQTSRAGEYIFREGDKAEDIFIIASGNLVISKRISPDKEKILSLLGEKSVFGEMALFSDMPRSATAQAKTDIVYYRIPCDELRKIFNSDPIGGQKFLEEIVLSALKRLEQTSRELATVYEISNIIARNLPKGKFAETILNQICYSVPGINAGLMFVWNEFNEAYELSAAANVETGSASLAKDHPGITFILSHIKAEGEGTFVIEDVETIRQQFSDVISCENIIVTPLERGEILEGFILVLNTDGRLVYNQGICDLMNSIAYQVTGAIENIKKREEELAKERLERARQQSIQW